VISTSEYEFPPNPWKLFTAVGGPVETDADLRFLGGGAAVYLYVGGQFIWPGVRIGHKISVPVPVAGGHKHVTLTTVSLRPMALVLSGFLTPDECDFIKQYAANRMVPSGLAMMDSTAGNQDDVRTSTQTFMERNGSPQIRALEERAHNLTRLPYELGENIQVVRYKVGQKYGAHRDFFNPNDYHRQPQMLRSVEYGGRNRMATGAFPVAPHSINTPTLCSARRAAFAHTTTIPNSSPFPGGSLLVFANCGRGRRDVLPSRAQ